METGHNIQQDRRKAVRGIFTAMTKWSCAVKFVASCPMPVPLWVPVWRLTTGLSNRTLPCMPGFQHFFSPPILFVLNNSFKRQYLSLWSGPLMFSCPANDEEQNTAALRQRYSHTLIALHRVSFFDGLEINEKHSTDIMSKYLLERKVHKEKTSPLDRDGPLMSI